MILIVTLDSGVRGSCQLLRDQSSVFRFYSDQFDRNIRRDSDRCGRCCFNNPKVRTAPSSHVSKMPSPESFQIDHLRQLHAYGNASESDCRPQRKECLLEMPCVQDADHTNLMFWLWFDLANLFRQ
jgi:hypothetical protein